jgi:hypothetical protein
MEMEIAAANLTARTLRALKRAGLTRFIVPVPADHKTAPPQKQKVICGSESYEVSDPAKVEEIPVRPVGGYLVFPFSTNATDPNDLNSYLLISAEVWGRMGSSIQQRLLQLIVSGAHKKRDCEKEEFDGDSFYSLKFRGHSEGKGGLRIFFDIGRALSLVDADGKRRPGYVASAFFDPHRGSGRVTRVPPAEILEGWKCFDGVAVK